MSPLVYLSMEIVLLVGLPPVVGGAAPAGAETAPAQVSMGDLLRPDGTLDLATGFRGSLDPSG